MLRNRRGVFLSFYICLAVLSYRNEDPIERRRSSSGPVEACGACEGGPGGSSPSGDLLVYSKVLTQRSNIITQAQQG